eukprot:jgi/Mesvir1/23193/Mv24230-RA.1
MAEQLASIFGTEKDRIGSCRHGERCSRIHNKPTISPTLLFSNMYQNPDAPQAANQDGRPAVDPDQAQEHFEAFYEDVFEELSQYGEIEEMNVCDNLSDHMIGNLYVKFREEEDAAAAHKAMTGRYYAGRPIVVDFSPVTDFREATCRQFEENTCNRGGYCSFMHLKKISRSLRRELFGRHGGYHSYRSRSPERRGGRDDHHRDRDRDRRDDYRDRRDDRRDDRRGDDRRGGDRRRRERSRSNSPGGRGGRDTRDGREGDRSRREGSEERRARIQAWNREREAAAAQQAGAPAGDGYQGVRRQHRMVADDSGAGKKTCWSDGTGRPYDRMGECYGLISTCGSIHVRVLGWRRAQCRKARAWAMAPCGIIVGTLQGRSRRQIVRLFGWLDGQEQAQGQGTWLACRVARAQLIQSAHAMLAPGPCEGGYVLLA